MNSCFLLCIFLVVVLGGSPNSLQATVKVSNLQDCADFPFDPNLDYFPDKVASNIAKHFEVDYYKSFKIVRNIEHDETYVLYQCGTPKPGEDARVQLPEALPDDAKFFEIPIKSGVALPDTTIVTFVELLGLRSSVSYISSYYTSPCFKKLVNSGQVQIWNAQNAEMATAIFDWGNKPADKKHIAAGTLSGDPGTLNVLDYKLTPESRMD
jgi:hypothetical protein